MTGIHDADGAYTEPIHVTFRDTDREGHIKLSVWLAWLAELAGDDYEARGLGREELIRRGQVFLINRFALRVYRMPRLYETLNASTWEHGTELVYFYRHYAFETPSGERVADAKSAWLLCDPEKHRILRPRALQDPVRDITRPNDCPEVGQIELPADLQPRGQRTIGFTDLDANRHVYCANYGNIIADALPEAIVSQAFRMFEITYVKEAMLGETLNLSGADTPAGYVLAGHHADGNASFVSRIRV